MALYGEQIGRGQYMGRTWRRYAKRHTVRKRRQDERRDPENAPEKNYYAGWAD